VLVIPFGAMRRSDGLAAGPATLDSLWVKQPLLVPVGAPYQVEVVNGFDYFITKANGKGQKICAMAQDDEAAKAR